MTRIALEIDGPGNLSHYRNLWLKLVTGFDASKEGSKCLVGEYLGRVHSGSKGGDYFNMDLGGSIQLLVLRGETGRQGDERDFFIACAPDPEGRFTVKVGEFSFAFSGAARISTEPQVDLLGAEGHSEEWVAGAKVFGETGTVRKRSKKKALVGGLFND